MATRRLIELRHSCLDRAGILSNPARPRRQNPNQDDGGRRRLCRFDSATTYSALELLVSDNIPARSRHELPQFNQSPCLPFANTNGDANTDYLSDGITESFNKQHLSILRSACGARSTVFRFKGQQLDPQQIGRTLGVSAILTGRVSATWQHRQHPNRTDRCR